MLWLKVKSPVRIYDRQACIALDADEGDLSAFNAAFSARFSRCIHGIQHACSKLYSVISYTVNPNMSAPKFAALNKAMVWGAGTCHLPLE